MVKICENKTSRKKNPLINKNRIGFDFVQWFHLRFGDDWVLKNRKVAFK